MNSYQIGDVAELAVAADLAKKGYQVAFPFSTSCSWDLLLIRNDIFEKIQVKSVSLKNGVVPVKNKTHSNTSKKQTTRKYTSEEIDWFAVYCPELDDCFYIPISMIENKSGLNLRVYAPKNFQTSGVFWAKDFLSL